MDLTSKCCVHCQRKYDYVLSGAPHDFPKDNNARYCRTCARVIRIVLALIPPRFICVEVPTDEVTLEQLQQWKDVFETYPAPAGRIRIPSVRKYFLTHPHPIKGRRRINEYKGGSQFMGRTYRVTTFEEAGEVEKIVLLMEKDRLTGKFTGPW